MNPLHASNCFHDSPAPALTPTHQQHCYAGGNGCSLGPRYGRVLKCCLGIVLLVLAAIMVASMAGCSDAQLNEWKVQVAQYKAQLSNAKSDYDALVGQRDVLEQALQDAQATLPADADEETRQQWQAAIDDLRGKLDKITGGIDTATQLVHEYEGKLQDLGQKILDAETGEEAIGSTIAAVGGMVGTATGQVLITAATGVLGGMVTWFGTRKRREAANEAAKAAGVAAGAAAVATGIEAARNDSLEASNPGFLVVEKSGASISHRASGVSDAIANATKN